MRRGDARWWARAVWALLRVRPIYFVADLLTLTRFVVEGESMAPALVGQQYVLVSRLAYRLGAPSRGDVVVAREPPRPEVLCIKRVAGLPGDEIWQQGGRLWVNGVPLHDAGKGAGAETASRTPFEWLLGDGDYLVLGDNRDDSRDSRAFGPVTRDQIIGKVWFCYWPRERWGRVR